MVCFSDLETPLFAEFIGMLLGAGCIGSYQCKAGNRTKIQRVVKITLDSRNGGYVPYTERMFEKLFSIKPKTCYKSTENVADVRTFRKEVFDFLTKEVRMAISPKRGRARIPDRFMNPDYYPHILRGIFDTDGCVSIYMNNGSPYPRLELKLCPSQMQTQFERIFEELGFAYKVQHISGGGTRIRLSGRRWLQKWQDIIGFRNPIHLEKSRSFLEG